MVPYLTSLADRQEILLPLSFHGWDFRALPLFAFSLQTELCAQACTASVPLTKPSRGPRLNPLHIFQVGLHLTIFQSPPHPAEMCPWLLWVQNLTSGLISLAVIFT